MAGNEDISDTEKTIWRFVGKMVKGLLLLLLAFVFVAIVDVTLRASEQLLFNTQWIVMKTHYSGVEAEAAVNLQINAYKAVVNEVIAPLLTAFVLSFLGYVTGVTVTTVSYNRGVEKGKNIEALRTL
ncbi:MAG: hypothetical protein R2844_07150 [Caldilineales bacterium]